MPVVAFLANCPDCGQFQVCVLSIEVQPRLRCPRCRAVYASVWEDEELPLATTLAEDAFEQTGGTATLVVVQNLPSLYPSRRRKKRRKAKRQTQSTVAVPQQYEPVVPVAEPTSPEPLVEPPKPVQPRLPTPVTVPAPPRRKPARPPADDEDEYGRLRLNAAAILTLFLVAGALASAQTGSATGLVRPLAGFGVAIGLVAVVMSGLAGRRLFLAVGLALVAATVFTVSFAAPELLGPCYAASQETVPSESEIQVLPHPQFVRDKALRAADWPDARKAKVRQGRTSVEVLGAEIEQSRAASAPNKPRRFFLIHLRLRRNKTPEEMEAGAFAPALLWSDSARATLWDSAGNRYEQEAILDRRPFRGKPAPSGSLVTDESDEMLAFPLPANPYPVVKLELPAAAWGGIGTVKFAIPGSMIVR
jgi:hypothetical protein